MPRDKRAEIIERLLAQHGRSVRQLAAALRVNHQSVANWLTGTNRPRDPEVWGKMLAFATYGTDAIKSKEPSNGNGKRTVQVFRTGVRNVPIGGTAQAGKPDPSQGDVDYYEMMDWGGDFDRWGKVAAGFSMEPEIEPGDWIIFENRRAENGHVVHALKENDEAIKILDMDSQQLLSLANGYDPIPADGWEILGVAVHRVRKGEHDSVDTRSWPHGLRIRRK